MDAKVDLQRKLVDLSSENRFAFPCLLFKSQPSFLIPQAKSLMQHIHTLETNRAIILPAQNSIYLFSIAFTVEDIAEFASMDPIRKLFQSNAILHTNIDKCVWGGGKL